MTTRRFYIIIIAGLLLPWFFPGVRDVLFRWDTQTGATARVRSFYTDTAAPATVALIKQAQKTRTIINGKLVQPVRNGQTPAADDTRMKNGGMTLTTEQAEAILKEYGSPAQGYGYAFVQGSQRTGIDNAWVMAMFIQESTAGKNGVAAHTLSSGNIKCVENPCYGEWQAYSDWAAGINAHFDLLNEYVETAKYGNPPHHHKDIIDVLKTWAPADDSNNQNINDPNSYPNTVLSAVRSWRKVNQGQYVTQGDPGQMQTVTLKPVNLPPGEKVRSVELPLSGFGVYSRQSVQENIVYSVQNSPGLQSVTIPPGGDWSFNQNWTVDVNKLTARDYGIMVGEGVCDLAGRYSNAAHKLGLQTSFMDHRNATTSVKMALVPDEDNVVITGTPGERGGADLVIRNTSDKTARFAGVIENDTFYVYGWYE